MFTKRMEKFGDTRNTINKRKEEKREEKLTFL